MKVFRWLPLAALLAGWPCLAVANPMPGDSAGGAVEPVPAPAAPAVPPTAAAGAPPASPASPAPPCDCVVVPALTIVDIAIVPALSSATAKAGETFAIRLASPIAVSGEAIVPAGVVGLGEVIHAQKSGMGGGGGELLLGARYLEVDGRRLRLRSFRAGRFGKNQTGAAMATTFAFGVFGLAVKGKNIEFAAGSVAEAKVAEAFIIPRSALPLPAPAVPATSESTSATQSLIRNSPNGEFRAGAVSEIPGIRNFEPDTQALGAAGEQATANEKINTTKEGK